jgi:hypothetical protein
VDRAEGALAAVGHSPRDASAAAAAVLAEARRESHAEAAAVAYRVLALSARELDDLSAARRHISASVATARRAGLTERAAQALTTQAALLFVSGRLAQAFSALDEAEALASRPQRDKIAAQRAALLWQSGRVREGVAASEHLLRRRSRLAPLLVADVLTNLSAMHDDLDRQRDAMTASVEAGRLFDELGLTHAAATVVGNRAYLLARAGRIDQAMAAYGDAERRMAEIGAPVGWLLVGQTQLLLGANLADEALATAQRAVAASAPPAPTDLRAEAWWRLAAARLLAGDASGASDAARQARRLFVRLASPGRAAVARRLDLRARCAVGGPSARALRAAVDVAEALARAGLTAEAVEARLDAVQIALAIGARSVADEQRAAIGPRRWRGGALVRATAWRAEALWQDEYGERRRAERAVVAGLRILADFRGSIGATELRAQASGHGLALAQHGVALALRSGSPARVLAAAERWRAGALGRRPRVGPDVAAELAALRRVVLEQREAAGTANATDTLQRRQETLEASVRRLSRQAAGDGVSSRPVAVRGLRSVAEALGGRALIELVRHGDELHAVVMTGGRTSLHALGPVAPVLAELDGLGFALRRLARPGAPPASTAAARAAAEHALHAIDAALLGPLRSRIGDRSLVVVPTVALHAVPWAALPTNNGRAVSVAPSSAWWAGVMSSPRNAARQEVTLVAGPGLPGADAEVRALSALYPDATVLVGAEATVAATTAALDTAALAHLSCHGRFRSDNPMFSCLEVADGPLTVYDLEHLSATPQRVVLAACDSGVPAERPGDEILGLLTALFSLDTGAVVASVVPVPDLDTTTLMLALHHHVRAGGSLAEGLAAARGALDATSATGFAVATAFVCFGAA